MFCAQQLPALSGFLKHFRRYVCLFPEEKTLLCCSILRTDVARRKKRRFSVLFIDWEAQYQCTIAHILKMREMYRDVTETFYWVALP